MSAIYDLIEWALTNGGHNDKELAKLAGVDLDKLEAENAVLQARVVDLEAENRNLLLSRNGLEVGYKKQSKEIIRLERIIDKARASQKLPT